MECIYARCRREIPDGSAFCPWCGRKQARAQKKKARRAKGAGSVYKVGGNRKKPWVAIKGGHSIGGCYATEREAREALSAYENVQDVELFNLTTEGVYDRWGRTAYNDCKPSFRNDYVNAWKHFPQSVRSTRFRDIRAADIQAILDDLFEQGKSASVQNKVKSLFAFLCGFGISNDIITKDYSKFLKIHQTGRRRDTSVFTSEELEKISALAEGPASDQKVQTARVIMIYLFTGMRLNELLPLECAAVHLEVDFPYLVGGEKTEAGRDRVVPIISTIRPYVQWFLENAIGPKLFSGYAGNKDPKNWRTREYYPLLDELGIPRHTPHGTRRTTATMAVQANVDPAALQKIGGWREFDTIQKYYNKPNVEYLYTEMEKLETSRKRLQHEKSAKGSRKKAAEN